MKRQSHKGRARATVRGRAYKAKQLKAAKPTDYFALKNFPLIRKHLLQCAKNCKHRKNTGKITTSVCCRVERGQVFRCLLYGHEPAKLFDCINCKKSEAVNQGAEWIKPLVQLSRGLEPQQSLHEVQLLVEYSVHQSTGSSKESGDLKSPGMSGASTAPDSG